LEHPALDKSLATAFQENSTPPTIRKYPSDPRDIKSPETHRRYAQAIADYLEKIGFKEFVPQYKTVRSLSSKDFYYIYIHLVQHYDPSVRHKNKVDEQVIEIMNLLKYPLRDGISRKSLLSIGAIHSNAQFYGVLHWLMEACKSRDVSNPAEFEDPPLQDLQIEAHAMAAAFAAFAFAVYHKFLASRDEPTYDEEMDPFRHRFAVIEQERDRDIQELDAEIAALHEEAAMLESSGSSIEELKKRNNDLTRDGAKFRTYCQEKRKRVDKYKGINKVVQDEVLRLDSESKKLEEQKAELEAKLTEKQVSLKALESMAKQHEQEVTRCAELTTHLETRRLAYNEKMETLTALRDKVRKQVDDFNVKIKKLFSATQEQQEFMLMYNPGATSADEMLSYDVKQKLIPILDRLDMTEREALDRLTVETQRLREKTDELNVAIEQTKQDWIEKQKEVEAKTKKLDDEKRAFMEKNDEYNKMIDQHEKAIDEERNQSRNAFFQAKNSLLAVESSQEELNRQCKVEQETALVEGRQLQAEFLKSQKELILMGEGLIRFIREQKPVTQ
ncbi:hypothetical protein MBANPS3_012505, partial [Mucor bainieri]